ncbi:hypothetical protein ElyMa_005590000 [Elysia marginata]|uniref:Uncharacterized protein n=1 Tax=Elysia marginata TaxID=1093978 RepID=A0AAV4F3A3_9GAST|nr:hypothetical protein ElyMa_005590000 [Elysia marginata]
MLTRWLLKVCNVAELTSLVCKIQKAGSPANSSVGEGAAVRTVRAAAPRAAYRLEPACWAVNLDTWVSSVSLSASRGRMEKVAERHAVQTVWTRNVTPRTEPVFMTSTLLQFHVYMGSPQQVCVPSVLPEKLANGATKVR